MTDSLNSRVAIVTGGASGIGKAVVEIFAEAGISAVTVADVDYAGASEVAAGLSRHGSCRVLATGTDVSRQSDAEKMVARTMDQFGRVDILVNNAGIAPSVRWPEVTEENWRHVMDVNLNGAFLCLLSVLPHMRQQRWGRVVNVSSVGAFVGSITAHPAYGVSKAGLIAMTKSAAKEHAAEGILVNAVAPGSIDTPLTDSFGAEQKQAFAQTSPLKRQGTPREIAEAVLFLVSEQSTYITGTTLHVNGGSLLV